MLKQIVILMFGAFVSGDLLAMDEQYPNHYSGKPNSSQLTEVVNWINKKQHNSGLTIPELDVEVIKIGYNYARLPSVVYALLRANQEKANAKTLEATLNSFGIDTITPKDGITKKWIENALKQNRAPSPREYAQMWHDMLRCEIEDGNEEGNPQALECAGILTAQKVKVEQFLEEQKTVKSTTVNANRWCAVQ